VSVVAFFLIVGCERDDVTESSAPAAQNMNKSKITGVSRSDLEPNSAISIAIRETDRIINLKTKSYEDTHNNIFIDEYNGKHLTDGDYESYTFPIIDEPGQPLRNLMFTKVGEDSYQAVLITYHLTEGEIAQIESGETVDNSRDKINFLPISTDFNFKSGGGRYVCDYVWRYSWEDKCQGERIGDPDCVDANGSRIRVRRAVLVAEFCGWEELPDDGSFGGGPSSWPGNAGQLTGLGGGEPGEPSDNNGEDPDPDTDPDPEQAADDDCLTDTDGNCAGDRAVLTRPAILVGSDTQDFFDSLNDPSDPDMRELHDYIQNSDQNQLREDIDDYLTDENHSDEAKAFVEDAIKVDKDGGDVDFEEKIIESEEFKNDPCLGGILDEFSSSAVVQDYLDRFDGSNPVSHLKFTVGVDPTFPNAEAVTYQPNNYVVEIKFNKNNISGDSATEIASTFFHELIHAEIYRKLLSLVGGPNITWSESDIFTDTNNFPGLYDYYTRYWFNPPNGQDPTSPQHNLMGQHYIDTMTTMLQQFDPSLTQIEAAALAWLGLKHGTDSDSFTTYDPNTGLYVDAITNANESSPAWSNLTQNERLQLNQTYSNYKQNAPPCQ